MPELYPLIEKGRVVGVIGSGGDATKLCKLNGECQYYFWLNTDEAVNVTGLLTRGRVLEIRGPKGRGFAPIASWLASPPYVHARAVPDIDEYVRWLARNVGGMIRGRRILLGFSGGKDSVAALITLVKLMEYVSFKLHVMYIHIPFLESPRSVKFVEYVSRKLGIEIEMLEAPRRDMKTLLKWKGMPRRGFRFCTVYKAKPMRKLRKEDPRLIEVIGDRLTESPKRFERLSKAAMYRVVLVGRKFRPTYLYTLLDVVDIVKRHGLVHPDYLDGVPRVACSLCPYKALHEFRRLPELENLDLIERVWEKMWKKWYSWTSFDVFRSQHLWRFSAILAKPLLYAKELVAEKVGDADRLTGDYVEEAYRRVWMEPTPKAPELEEPWTVAELALRAWKKRLPIAIPEQ